ncbi:MAG: hypothetical protein MMC33_009405 [Icmadophila ericetorum]|nr:hypothetical protein [Icmadophila ericetorum]
MKGLLPAKIVNELNLGAGKKGPLMMEITNGDSNNFLGREISKLEDNLKTELRESLRVESEGRSRHSAYTGTTLVLIAKRTTEDFIPRILQSTSPGVRYITLSDGRTAGNAIAYGIDIELAAEIWCPPGITPLPGIVPSTMHGYVVLLVRSGNTRIPCLASH